MPISHWCQLDGISAAWFLSRRSAAAIPAVTQATSICPFNLVLEFSEYSRVHQAYVPSGLVLLELYMYLTPQNSQGKRGEILSMFDYRHYRTDQFSASYQTASQLYLIEKIFQ